MSKRKPPTVADPEDLDASQGSIEAELAALQEGLERLKAQLAQRRTLDAAVRALTSLSKRKPKAKAPVKRRTAAKPKANP